MPETPAAVAGLQKGDVLTAANGMPVNSQFALRRIVRTAPPGTAFTLTLLRDGRAIPDVAVTSVEMRESPGAAAD